MPRGKFQPWISRIAVSMAGVLALTACGGSGGSAGGGGGEEVELTFAHSYATTHPQHRCGAQKVAGQISKNGMKMEIFPNSQLGPDGPDRVQGVKEGDVSIDIQGSSAISAIYEPIGALDAAYAFDGPDQLFEFVESPEWGALRDDMLAKTGIRILDAWYFGMRHYTANKPIRTPDDLKGQRMRFPESPQFLQNAKAMGANATPVAFEEVFLSLQQGVIDGQENPIPTIKELNLPEVQSHVSLSGHQTGFTVAIISEETWKTLSAEQQKALQAAITQARDSVRKCVEDAEQKILTEWKSAGKPTVVEDVDRDAFKAQVDGYLGQNMKGGKLDLYNKVRETTG